MKKLLSCIIALLATLAVSAASYTTITVDGIDYRLYEGTMEAHVYSAQTLSVTNNRLELPESVTNGTRTYTVTEIEYFHCGYTSSLELVVPKTVRKVSSVLNGVSKLVLGSGVNSVSEMHQCNVQEFEVVDDNQWFSTDEIGVLYNKDKTVLVYAPYGRNISNYIVPSTVTSIGSYAFYKFESMGAITLPEGLKEINDFAFWNCKSLKDCSLPSTVESIGRYAFYSCPLTNFSLPIQIRTIGSYAFDHNSGTGIYSLQSLRLPRFLESIGDYAFQNTYIDSIYAYCKPFHLPSTTLGKSHWNQTLVVPKGTRDIFSTRNSWNMIDNVIEGDFDPTFQISNYSVGSPYLDQNGQIIAQAGVTYNLYDSGVARIYCDDSYTYYPSESSGTTLKIPESVYYRSKHYTVDGVNYFKASKVVDLMLPNTITSVKNVKSGVKILKLPKNVKVVEGLHYNSDLWRFEVADDNEFFSVDEKGVLYSKDKSKLWFAPYGRRGVFDGFIVPSTVTDIGQNAFYSFESLSAITLPEGLKVIDDYAFYNCSSLKDCQLPSTVESIGRLAFYNCPLYNFSLPSQIRSIAESAFGTINTYSTPLQGGSLRSLHLPQYLESIGDYAFKNLNIDTVYAHCEPFNLSAYEPLGNTKTLVVPRGTRDIFSTYKYWNQITNIIEGDFEPTFPLSKYPIGSTNLDREGQIETMDGVSYSFYSSGVARVYCANGISLAAGVTSLTIPESVYFRGRNYTVDGVAYFSSSQIVDLLLPNTVTFISYVTSGVQILKIPKSVTSVSNLNKSTNLIGFEVAEGNESFCVDENGILYSKDKTKLCVVPYAKYKNMTSFSVPSTVAFIGPRAFSDFSQLARVTLPDGLKKIGDYAFNNCSSLAICPLPQTVEYIGVSAFYDCPLVKFSLPVKVRSIGDYAFDSMSYLSGGTIQSLDIPQYVENIGYHAFYSVRIDSVKSHVMVPSPISTDAFYSQYSVKLVVPTGTKDEYKVMGGWKTMTDITESDLLLPISNKCDIPEIVRDKDTLTIFTRTKDAIIYYTMDGSDPDENSLLYDNNPIVLKENCTVKAMAVKEGLENSEIATFKVNWFKVSEVKFKWVNLQVELSTETEDAVIRYTLDGTDPTDKSTAYQGTPLSFGESCTIKAFAMKQNWNSSRITSFDVDLTSVTCATPTFRRSGKSLVIETATVGGQIYYTLDDTEPTANSLKYDANNPITPTDNCTVRAVVMKEGFRNSEIGIYNVDWFAVADVAIELVNLKVEMRTETEGATIRYTVDGTDPTEQSAIYISPISLPDSTIVKAFATKQKLTNSNVTTYMVDLKPVTCVSPTFRLSGTQLIIETSTIGGVIYYTLDGTEPTKENGIKYDSPFALTRNCLVKAVVTKDGFINSSIATYVVSSFTVSNPIISANGSLLTITSSPSDATIYYTLDGKDPTVNSNRYEGPIELTGNGIVKAFAIREGYNDSEIVTYDVDFFTVADIDIKLVNLQIEMSTATEGAIIHYTLNGEDPTEQSPVYQGMPLSISENCIIKAFGMKAHWNDSKVTTYNLDFSTVTCGNPTFRMSGKQLVIETSTIGATIYYTLDETEPTKQSSVYEGPVTLDRNCIVKAVVMKDGYRNSVVETYEVSVFNVSVPTITLNGNMLTITTEPSDATIYYTLNGTTPTANSSRYDGPIELTGNCTVKAIAYKDGYQTSPIATYVVDAFTVADVEINLVNLQIVMSTATEGATIRYTLNGEEPTEQSFVYQGMPLSITENCTIKAIGMKPNWNNSRVTTYELDFSTVTCTEPTFRMSGKQLIIESSTVGGVIYYTLDETEPTKQSSVYEGPITLNQNCIVKAVVMKEGYRNSPVATYEVTSFAVSEPTFTVNGTILMIQCKTEGAEIFYAIGENAVPQTKYVGGITLTDNQPVRAFAKKAGYTDSPIVEYIHSLITCQPATLKEYDGRYFTLNVLDGTKVYYTLDGSKPNTESSVYEGRTPIDGRCTLKTLVTKEWTNDSEITTIELNYYFDGENADVSSVGQLKKSMEWADKSEITSLVVSGPLNADDLGYIKNNLVALLHLNLEKATIEGNAIPNEAFAGMSLLTFTSPKNINSVGSRIFANCQHIAAIVWNANERIPSNSFGDELSPNLLVYAMNKMYAPSSVRNVVVNGVASEILLSDAATNNNFYCPKAFKANKISYVHNYSMETGMGGKAAGWETIVLPFTVQKIAHESKGELTPYLKFEQEGYPEGGRPFWLRELKEGGFEDAAVIEANTPYIISMPNNPEYAKRYNIAGNVTFSAEQADVLVSTELKTGKKDLISLVPTFISQAASSKIWVLNRNETVDNDVPGSVFVPGLRDVQPFEAYTTNEVANAPKMLSISELIGNTTGIYEMFYSKYRSTDNVKVYNLSGNLVVSGKRADVMKKLAKGVYIIDGKKIIIE